MEILDPTCFPVLNRSARIIALAFLVLTYDFAGASEIGQQSRPFANLESPTLLLYGVVIVEPGSKLAFIHDGNSHSRIRRVREGQTIAGARVKEIFSDRVMLIYRGAEIDLRLWSTKGDLPASGLSPGDDLDAVVSPRPLSSAELSKPLIYRQRLYPQAEPASDTGQPSPDPASDDEGMAGDNDIQPAQGQ